MLQSVEEYGIQKGETRTLLRITSKQLKLKFQEKADRWISNLAEYKDSSLEKIIERFPFENSLEKSLKDWRKKTVSKKSK